MDRFNCEHINLLVYSFRKSLYNLLPSPFTGINIALGSSKYYYIRVLCKNINDIRIKCKHTKEHKNIFIVFVVVIENRMISVWVLFCRNTSAFSHSKWHLKCCTGCVMFVVF